MSEIFKCSRGFLIERRADGKFTPFFVKVRTRDIIDDKGKPIFSSDTNSIEGVVNVSNKNKWVTKKYMNGYYEAYTSLRISNDYFERPDGDNTTLKTTIELPIPVDENTLNVSFTSSGRNDNIATSIFNFIPVIEDEKVTKIIVNLRNLSYTFPSNWDKDITYIESKIYVTVSGM